MRDILISLLPIVLIVVVFVFFGKKIIKYSKENSIAAKLDKTNKSLEEIKSELRELNKINSEKKL